MATGSKPAWSDILTVDQVAAYLQLTRITIYRYIREGRLPAARVGKAYRIRKSDVEWFLDSRRTTTGAQRIKTAAPSRAANVRPTRRESTATSPLDRRPSREDLLTINPLEWVARGLH